MFRNSTYVPEATKLLADLHYHKSKTRRSYAYLSINYSVAEVAAEQKIDDYLFGKEFREKLNRPIEAKHDSKEVANKY